MAWEYAGRRQRTRGPKTEEELEWERALAEVLAEAEAALAPFRRYPDDPALTKGTHPNRYFGGAAYKKAGDYMLNRSEALKDKVRLVHGSTLGSRGLRFGTAWVEVPGGLIFDGVWQRFFERDGYLTVKSAVAEVIYTTLEMCRKMREESHWGPWHGEFRRSGGVPEVVAEAIRGRARSRQEEGDRMRGVRTRRERLVAAEMARA